MGAPLLAQYAAQQQKTIAPGTALLRVGVLCLAFLCAIPQPLLAADNEHLLQSGPYAAGKQNFTLIDTQRTTAAADGNPEKTGRVLETSVWYPAQDRPFEWLRPGPRPLAAQACPAPLVIYSHGFMSFRGNGAYLAEYLASHGYIVAAANFPLTRLGTAGGPRFTDVLNQPGDVSFIIDTLLVWSNTTGHPFAACIDARRIGAVGLSLGGMTTTLLAFHPQFRDPRIGAAVAIAGPVGLFGARFFENAATPFMMIAGDIDAMVEYAQNAARLGAWLPDATLVTIHGGSHTGFAGVSRLFRWVDNPDSIGCWALGGKLDDPPEIPDDFIAQLRGYESAALPAAELRPCRNPELPTALRPQRQLALTKFSVFAFFESQFNSAPLVRDEYTSMLLQLLAQDNTEVSVTSGKHVDDH